MATPPTPDCNEPGRWEPRIDRNRCEGNADCLRVCPCGVFAVAVLPAEQRKGLSLLGRLKAFAHGYQQAQTPRAADCRACGLCVTACPERAIQLVVRGR